MNIKWRLVFGIESRKKGKRNQKFIKFTKQPMQMKHFNRVSIPYLYSKFIPTKQKKKKKSYILQKTFLHSAWMLLTSQQISVAGPQPFSPPFYYPVEFGSTESQNIAQKNPIHKYCVKTHTHTHSTQQKFQTRVKKCRKVRMLSKYIF